MTAPRVLFMTGGSDGSSMWRSLNVTPDFAPHDLRDGGCTHAIIAPKRTIRDTPEGMAGADSPNLVGCKARTPVAFTAWLPYRPPCWRDILEMGATFRHAIVNIVLLCANKHVVGANAEFVVAVVKQEQASGDAAVNHFVGEAMGAIGFEAYTEFAVAIGVQASGPLPTLGAIPPVPGLFVDLCPETRRGGGLAILRVHGEPPIRCAMPGAVTSSAPASLCPNYTILGA